MKRITTLAAVAMLALAAGTISASADNCSGRDHRPGTVLGAGGGALVGGLASHSVAGAVVCGVAGGLVGNAISRSEDWNRHELRRTHRSYYVDRYGHPHNR